LAHVEALGRHIGEMEADAAKAINEKYLWEGHLDRCSGLEQKEVEWRRAIAKDHAEQLKLQMRQDEEKRMQGRDDYVTLLSMHDFPCFREEANDDVRSYLQERRVNLKQDLDQQIEAKIWVKRAQKDRDKLLEMSNIEASQFETDNLKKMERAKKQVERSTLAHSWDQDVRLKTVKKAIQDHHKTPGKHGILSQLVSTISGSPSEGGQPLSPLALPSPRLDTPAALSDRSSLASSRMSGSVRRAPLGAAASLALHKEKLRASGPGSARR
jgi:hypothetical protein